jgi:dihydropyrimidine dehydrogenase (NAD+) subunit PreA
VGCNLCEITCPVEACITMVPQETGKPYMNWTQDPRNPRAEIQPVLTIVGAPAAIETA